MRAGMAIRHPHDPQRAPKPGHRSFVVQLGVPEDVVLPKDRGERRAFVADQGLVAGAAFRSQFLEDVATAGMTEDVSYVGNPMSLPFLIVVATPEIAERARHLPGVVSVIDDDTTAGLFDPRSRVNKALSG